MKVFNINQIIQKEVLVSNEKIKLICFVFEQGNVLPNHTHNGVAIIQVISGSINISFSDGNSKILKQGDIMEFDASIEHNVIAEEFSKFLVTIIN